jgi:hypothetical protein
MRARWIAALGALTAIVSGCSATSAPEIGSGESAQTTATSVCSADRWCWSGPQPTGNYLHGVRRLPDGKLVMFGSADTLLTSSDSGETWTGTTGVGWHRIEDLWSDMTSGTAIAVGSRGAILRYANGAWSSVDSGIQSDLHAVFGLSANDLWVASDSGLHHWDGNTWTKQLDGSLTGVWASSAQDIWVSAHSQVMHFDGSSWKELEVQTIDDSSADISGVWGTGRGNVWFSATRGLSGIYRYDTERNFIRAEIQRPAEAWSLTSIHGTGPDDIWAVGTYQAWHYDGSKWTLVATDQSPVPGLDQSYYAGSNFVHALAPDDVWVTGAHGFLSHWDGRAWRQSEGEPKRLGDMIGAASDGLILAGGRKQSLWVFSKYVGGFFDGARWQFEDNPVPNKWGGGTVAAFALAHDRFRVDRIDSQGPWQLSQHSDATGTWTSRGDAGGHVQAIWASAPDDVWLLGKDGITHFDGRTFTRDIVVGKGSEWGDGTHLFGSSNDHIWALNGGALYEWDGRAWTSLTFEPPAGVDLRELQCNESIWTDAPGHGFIGCWGALVEVSNGRGILHDLEGHQAITSIVGTARDLVAVGGSEYQVVHGLEMDVEQAYGAAYHYDGSRWTEEKSGLGVPFYGAHRDAETGETWAVSNAGILRRADTAAR